MARYGPTKTDDKPSVGMKSKILPASDSQNSMEVFRMKVYYAEALCDGALKTYPATCMKNILSPALANRSNFMNNVRKKLAHIGVQPNTNLKLTALPPVPPEYYDMSIQDWMRRTPGAAIVVSPDSETDALYHQLIVKNQTTAPSGKFPFACSTESDESCRIKELQDCNAHLQRELDHLMRSKSPKNSAKVSGLKNLSLGEEQKPYSGGGTKGPAYSTRSRSISPAIGKVSRIRHRPDQCSDIDKQVRDLQDCNGTMSMEVENLSNKLVYLEQQQEVKDDKIRALKKQLGNFATSSPGSLQPEWDSGLDYTTALMKDVYRRMFLHAVRNKLRKKLARAYPSPPGQYDFLTMNWADMLKLCAEEQDYQVKMGVDKWVLKVTLEDQANTLQMHGNSGIHIGIYADMVLTQDPLNRPAYKKLFRFLCNQDPDTIRNNLINAWTNTIPNHQS